MIGFWNNVSIAPASPAWFTDPTVDRQTGRLKLWNVLILLIQRSIWILSLATVCVWNTSSAVMCFLLPTKHGMLAITRRVGPNPQSGNPYPLTTSPLCCEAYSINRISQLIPIYFYYISGVQLEYESYLPRRNACHQAFRRDPALVVGVGLRLQ